MKYLIALSAFCLFTINAIAQQPGAEPAPKKELFRSVSQMPQFNGDLDKYLSDNIHYPEAALKNRHEGKVNVEFVVNSDGTVSDAKVLRSISPELDAEAIRVIMAMPKWKPGRQNGQLVNVVYVLPINFTITQPYSIEEISDVAKQPDEEPKPGDAPKQAAVFRYVEQMPEFPGDINKFIAQNIHYPKEDIKNQVEGRVFTQFVVNEDGSLSDIHIVRSVSPTIDAEAIRLVQSMPKWKPGKQNGRVVKTYYNLPLTFKLDDNK